VAWNGLFQGTSSNENIVNAKGISGVVAALTNGAWTNPQFTNGQNFGNAFRSPGGGVGSEQFGLGAIASAGYGTAFGDGAIDNGLNGTALGTLTDVEALDGVAFGAAALVGTNATGGISIGFSTTCLSNLTMALGWNATANFAFSSAVGHQAATTTNQLMLGTAGDYVQCPGNLSVAGVISNLTTAAKGTNTLAGTLVFPRYNNGSLATGANASVNSGTNKYIKLSGPSGAFTINGIAGGQDNEEIVLENSTGLQITLAQDSGVDPTPANRLYLPGAADIVNTNNPGFFGFKYDASVNRWKLTTINGVQATGGSGSFSGTFIGTIIVGNATNTPSFTLVNTNWISGAIYTNLTGRIMQVSGNAVLTTASVAGYSQMALQVPGSVTNFASVISAVAGLTGAMTNGMSPALVTNGGTFTWTNTSSGAGDTSTTFGGQYIVF
jgi:hypothetical protein